MSDTVIRVENLSKKYLIQHQQDGQSYKTMRDMLSKGTKSFLHPFSKNGMGLPTQTCEEFWALKDVSFEIKQGDRVGVIGRNGAGKSTLLKLLSRITEPTTGRISIAGRVASLLEVGTGFHPELTGRENIFLNGAVLGMSKTEIIKKFDEIVSFSEVDNFLDTPVKRYSSGMYVRLAFAVAAHLEPEILVVDEVLAVGDIQFQRKCLGKMNDVAKEGRTVIFVSHNMAAIKALCSGGIVLDKGCIAITGSISECIAVYEAKGSQTRSGYWKRASTSSKNSLIVEEVDSKIEGQQPNLQLNLRILLKSLCNHKPAFIAVDITDSLGIGIMQAIPTLENFLKDTDLEHHLSININLPPLIPGSYLVSVWVGSHNTETLDDAKEIVVFEIHDSPTPGRSFPHTADHGYIVPLSTLNVIN